MDSAGDRELDLRGSLLGRRDRRGARWGGKGPVLFGTRPPRPNESRGENASLRADEFGERAAFGGLGLRGTRRLEGTRQERYGFPPAPVGQLTAVPSPTLAFQSAFTFDR